MTRATRSRPANRRAQAIRPPSPSLERREREKAETRDLILAAARAMFTREGYERTTMRGIAHSIGYTATAIYHHFADKDALFQELCAADFRAFSSALTSISQVADPVERIRTMGQAYVRFAIDNPEQFRFMFLIDRPVPSSDAMHKNPGDDAYLALRNMVVEVMAAGRLREDLTDPDLVAQVLWGNVHGLATIHVATPPEKQKWLKLVDAGATCSTACAAVMRGLLRHPE